MSTTIETTGVPGVDTSTLSEKETRRRQVLLRAVEVLDEEGWQTGGGGMYPAGLGFCLLGAVAHAGGMPRDSYGEYSYLPPMRLVLGDSSTYQMCPYDWNDEVATSKEQVQEVLRRLADGMTWEDAISG